MIRKIGFAFLVTIAVATNLEFVHCQDDLRIWKEFINTLRSGKMTIDKIRPYQQLGDHYKPILLGYLDSVKTQAAPEDWIAEPEVIKIDNRTQYIIPWTTRNQKVSYCFSFITEGSHWYFQHLEAIFIRLDKISELPTSKFPDVAEDRKSWAREEIYWSFVIINVYLPTAKEKGKEYALSMLKDGGGYFVGARTWVPFSSPHKAFILYLCWEQANLRGNDVTLVKLEDHEAIVCLNTYFFALYSITSHLKPRISLEDYKQIFETIWQDRASNAGWNLDIKYSPDYEVTFHFTKRD
ncbi:MAG: hypothetical protein HY800_09635 [Ignavibacteriales bacterium]|nr:hypothetical protein [Ignavibacteriales bacterium]